jgi:hypothetical protein
VNAATLTKHSKERVECKNKKRQIWRFFIAFDFFTYTVTKKTRQKNTPVKGYFYLTV